jgi:chorismate dehydratase
MKIKLGVVSYLNSKPLVYALEHSPLGKNFELIYDVPSACAQMLSRGEVDLALLPSIEYARHEGLSIVPEICISSFGPVKSVMLFSRVSLAKIHTIAVDTSSRTSVALLKILCHKKWGLDPLFVPAYPDLETMLKYQQAALIIGDRALLAHRQNLLVYDLGEEWSTWTRRPFVYALWVGKKDALSPPQAQVLLRAKDLGIAHLGEIAWHYGSMNGWNPELSRSYFIDNIKYHLGNKEIQGLRLFYRFAEEQHLIEKTPKLSFYGLEE